MTFRLIKEFGGKRGRNTRGWVGRVGRSGEVVLFFEVGVEVDGLFERFCFIVRICFSNFKYDGFFVDIFFYVFLFLRGRVFGF